MFTLKRRTICGFVIDVKLMQDMLALAINRKEYL